MQETSRRRKIDSREKSKGCPKLLTPNLIKVLDADPAAEWYVTQYYPKGSLARNRDQFVGNLPAAVEAFRPLVAGVAKLHEAGLVHRDIKPENIFLGADDNLILGDFGLIFFADERHERLSGTVENVGSRDWMPGWAYTMKVEEVRPTFDVFSLGKLLWAMVSKYPKLPLWYFDRPNFSLERMFPESQYMYLGNQFFRKCIVEHETDCLPDAKALLEEVDQLLFSVEIRRNNLIRILKGVAKSAGSVPTDVL
jgi:serine/threonine protein kinase